MIRDFNSHNQTELEAVHRIQMAAYRLEADLLGVSTLPPMLESIDDLRRSSETVYIYVEGNTPVGAVFVEIGETFNTISKLIVDPSHLRKGIGKALVSHALNLHSGAKMKVCTGEKNLPAIFLYQNLGFKIERRFEVDGGLMLVCLRRGLGRAQ